MTTYTNVEKLQGKDHYTGYANFRGHQITYRIRNVKGTSKPGIVWRGFNPYSHIGAPLIYGKTLGEISSALYNLALQFPVTK